MHGERQQPPRRIPVLDGLIATVLSQNTTNVNSGRAFAALKSRFPNWDEARIANVRSIESAIRSGGLARVKSRRIKSILSFIHETTGKTSLEHLRGLNDDEVKQQLSAMPGVGPKTVSCVLLFAMNRQDFPVDTHVFRIAKRLGWVDSGTTREKAYDKLNRIVPPPIAYELHVLMVDHGKKICRSQSPRCADCRLNTLCPSSGALV